MSITEIKDSYKRYLLLEKGLSKNSIEAYMLDLQKLLDFAEEEQLSLKTMDLSKIETMLAQQFDKEISPRSLSRIIPRVRFTKAILFAKVIPYPPLSPAGKPANERNGEGGFPHSEIAGSKFAHNSPTLIAACHVLLRLYMPRHPPNALTSRLRIHTINDRPA